MAPPVRKANSGPRPAIPGMRDERLTSRGKRLANKNRGALALANLAQNLGRVLAEAGRGTLRGHRRAVQNDRRADAGNDAAFGGVAFEFELHAAMYDLRI